MEKTDIERVLVASGLWRADRRYTHGYILSPNLYEVDSVKLLQVERLGVHLYSCLAGLGRLAAISLDPKVASSRTWQMIGRVLCTGVPQVYRDIQIKEPGTVPVLCKVDLMQSQDGNYYIAEIDGHNKHGMGYMALHHRMLKELCPDAQTLQGVVSVISQYLSVLGESKLCLLYSHKERFYLSDFEILRDNLALEGIELVVVDEIDVDISGFELSTRSGPIDCKVYVDLPFLDKKAELAKVLADLYRAGKVKFLLPPKPFLSSKAVLALLRNDFGDSDLEAILRSQISAVSLGVIRSFIPQTFLISPVWKEECWNELAEQGFVLKEAISSGMKGTLFQEDEKFNKVLSEALRSPYRFVLQKEVTNAEMRFQYFGDDGALLEDVWFARIIVHFAGRKIADMELTARKDKRVHGAKDCLQLGTILV